jgi:hypothetical protein
VLQRSGQRTSAPSQVVVLSIDRLFQSAVQDAVVRWLVAMIEQQAQERTWPGPDLTTLCGSSRTS